MPAGGLCPGEQRDGGPGPALPRRSAGLAKTLGLCAEAASELLPLCPCPQGGLGSVASVGLWWVIAQNGKELCLWGTEDDKENKNLLFPAVPVRDSSVELCVLCDIDLPPQVQENVFSYRNHIQLKVQGAIFGCSTASLNFCLIGGPLLVSRLVFVFCHNLLFKCICMEKEHGRRSAASVDHANSSLQRPETRNQWITEEDLLF